ncbi:MAG: tRNA pseudouridine(55) synthase TruB [Bacteroides sp.]|nr:tRNA pseudouridine(55) synthase TruB [Bacillota bacterium]MCM1393865.1 tRNA pseudouridine(55) synthase TruB [[Eubacterium] siraeum]MCM1456207.1 tRNA pseudouridine(55) synthase TruB [Bacteroides sp.]
MTSSDVVVKVRGILRKFTCEKQKVGHLGTLDPLAIGVLPIAVGNATRLFDYMQKKQKTYIAAFKFGSATDTLDRGGKITAIDDKIIDKSMLSDIIPTFIGEVMQMPPQYSAKSVGGKKAYDIAREGGIADLQPKKINIYDMQMLGAPDETVSLPSSMFGGSGDFGSQFKNSDYTLSTNEYAFKITCGSGTYIRAIARDVASRLNTVGYMSGLCRTRVGDFDIDSAVTLKEFEKNPLAYILPIDVALKSYDKLDLNEVDGNKALNGIQIDCDRLLKSPIAVSVCGKTVGLGEIHCGKLRIKTRL